MPYGKIWRTGADEATLLITQRPIQLGGVTVAAGAYSLWTLPNADGKAKLIVNKQIGQWGISPRDPKQTYDQGEDVVRVELKKEAVEEPIEQFTISIVEDRSGGGILKLAWENTQYSTTFAVKK